jgi:hypothetical protein
VLPPVELTQAQTVQYEALPEAIKIAVTTHVRNSSTDMALDNVSAILISAGLKSELRTEILKNNYITLREIKDAALKTERMRKEKPIKANNSVNEINDQEPEIDAVNKKGNYQNNYKGNKSRRKVDTHLLEEATEGLPTTIIREHHQPVEKRADGGPVTRSKAKIENETKLKEIKLNFDYNSAPVRQAVMLIKKFELMNPVELFKHIILIKKPKQQIEKQYQLAANSREINQQSDSEQRATLEIV